MTTPADYEEDDDIIDIGNIYFKDIMSEDDIVYAGDGIYCVKNQLILTANEGISYNDVEELMKTYDASIVGYIELTNDYQIEFDNDIEINVIKQIIDELNNNSLVEAASLNIVTNENVEFKTNDAKWCDEWTEATPSGNNWGIETIKLESALKDLGVISSNSSIDTSMLNNVKIGVIDGGFDENHEDIDFTHVWNNFSDVAALINDGSHGTGIAGVMGAGFNNGKGITGICVKNRLYGFSTLGNLEPELSDKNSIFKLKYALALLIGNNVKVINRSCGIGDIAFCAAQGNSNAINYWNDITAEYDRFLCKLIDKGYDFLIITSAGNSNDLLYYEDLNTDEAPYGYVNVDIYNNNELLYPNANTSIKYGTSTSAADVILNDTDAKYDDEFQYSTNYKVKSRVVSVGSMNSSGNMSDFSCRGTRVDVLAPGEEIYSCAITGTGISGGDYNERRGTSIAAPHAAGSLGLAYSINPAISATRLKSTLTSTASNYNIVIGSKNCKVVNAAELVSKTQSVLESLTSSGKNISTQTNIMVLQWDLYMMKIIIHYQMLK